MKKRMINATHIEGFVYSLGNSNGKNMLEKKVTGERSKNPGTEFISGVLNIATDENCLNIIPVHFTYVTEKTAKGSINNTFTVLSSIIEGKVGNVMENGIENAGKVRIDSNIGLPQEFYDTNSKQFVAIFGNEGGFIHLVNELGEENKRATFETDIVLTKFVRKEADDENNIPEVGLLSGSAFNFRGEIIPVEYSVTVPAAMNYFEDMDISMNNPVFTRVKGYQMSKTVTIVKHEESAFGEDSVNEVQHTQKAWVVNWAQKEPYVWDDEAYITAQEYQEALSNRELHLAEIKQRREDYEKNKSNETGTTFTITSTTGNAVDPKYKF